MINLKRVAYLNDMLGDIGARFHGDYENDLVGEAEVPMVDLHFKVEKKSDFMKLCGDAEK